MSSVSVYADFSGTLREDDPLASLDPEHSVDELRQDYANYGALKGLCEQVVTELFAARHAIVRAGLIVGPHDPTGRFTYWPHRIARGGDVVAPAPPERTVQFIDARDLAAWMVTLCEHHRTGTFNATRPGVPWEEMLGTCQQVVGGDSRIVWLPDAFLRGHDVAEWMELPLWIADPQWRGMHRADVSRAIAAGLTFSPLDETARGVLEQAKPSADAGLTPEREAALLEAWRRRQKQGRHHGRGGSARSTSSG